MRPYTSKYTILTSIITLLLTAGCASPKPNTPSVKNTDDISLAVNEQGDVSMQKHHKYEDGNISVEDESISKSSLNPMSKGYEKIPKFDKNYSKSLALKNKKIHKKEKIKVQGSKVKVSVEAIPVNEFIDLIFSSVLKLNYTMSEAVRTLSSPITLNMTSLQPRQEVFEVVSKLLSINGIAIKKENGILFLSKKDSSSTIAPVSNVYIGYGREVSSYVKDDENILMFVPYNYIDGGNVVNVLRQIGVNKIQFFYLIKGMQMMKGKAGDIRQALKIINLVDRPYLEGKSMYLVELHTMEVTKFIDTMRKILTLNGITVSNNPTKGGIVLSPITELNSVLVVASKHEWLDMVLYWKKKLDIESEVEQEPKFYTYKVQNRKADDLAKALNSVLEQKLSKRKTTKQETKVKPTTKLKVSKTTKTALSTKRTIVFDLATNTLMMRLLPSEYRELLPLIKRLDALPLQVLAEVTLAEVTLTDSFTLGFEYTLRNEAAAKGVTLTDAVVGATLGNTGFAASYNSKKLDAAINALAENKILSILSKPKILILNNKTGNINVGTQIPIIKSELSATGVTGGTTPNINRNISYRNTGIVVGLTPTINSNGILTMNINLQLSEAQLNNTSGIDSPLIVNRTLTTSLTLKNGETVMLGGLVSKNKSTSDSGVPYLMDIPWIGSLFKSQSQKVVKTELIMLIKPYIIENTKQLSEKTRKYKSMMQLLDTYSLF